MNLHHTFPLSRLLRRTAACALLLALACIAASAQSRADIPELRRPRLVVGLMVDQMRWDYLIRYADHYGEGGLRRLLGEGWNCNRTRINYLPAVTAVGHASVWTGSVPALHGITGNSFPVDGQKVYCTYDANTHSVGTADSLDRVGRQSPHRLLVTTLGDELRLATNFRSRVVGIALKDRAAILPAGHAANAAYWFDAASGRFITSTYYADRLPDWLVAFNGRQLPKQYMKERGNGPHWPLLGPADSYTQSAADGQPWEDQLPRDVKNSPWGVTLTFQMARAAIEGERLGLDPARAEANVPDMLCLSLSSPDMLGHLLSPNSVWMEDTYRRLDRDLADFLTFLDETVGKDNYLFFLTADHAGMHNPAFMREHRLPGSTWESERMEKELSEVVGCGVRIANMQVWLDDASQTDKAVDWLSRRAEVAYAFPLNRLPDCLPEPIRTCVVNGYNPQRSGQIQIIFQSGVQEDYALLDELRRPGHLRKGTTHSVWAPDDTHIPLIFFGHGVAHAWDNTPHTITDIAATMAALLNIQEPSGCVGQPIEVRK